MDVWFPVDSNRVVAVTKAESVICTNHPIDDKPSENIYDSIKFTVLHGDVPDEIKEWKLFQLKLLTTKQVRLNFKVQF